MNYKSIAAAPDWFFLHDEPMKGKPIVWNLAAWALTDDGETIGLVAVSDTRTLDRRTPKLVPIPPVAGIYLHRDQLSKEELDAAKSR